ncbi:MAG: ABC transporter permease [Alkaliphilus sp.]|nr:MAG: ABC transporter permease [Alkaliphilus sp.]
MNKVIDKKSFWFFLAPISLTFIIVVIIPFIIGMYYSLTDWSAIPGATTRFIGFENYREIFADAQFRTSFVKTLIYAFYAVMLINIVGFSLALLVTRKLKTSNLLRTAFFMPNLIGGLILGYIWQFVFLEILPYVSELLNTGILGARWLSDPDMALWSMAIVSTWQMGGYIMIIYIAALNSIPKELIEAASLDGAGALQKIRHITFPMVAPAFTVSLFLTLSTSFKMFDVNIALTGGGPARLTELLALGIYNKAFTQANFGEGQAQAAIFFGVIAITTLTQVYFSKRKEVEM